VEGTVVYRPGMTMEELEEEAIRVVLAEVGGNRRKASERLGIGERTLYRKIKKFGLDDPEQDSDPAAT
jgi:DNA-binding NtrC family response regulator